MILRFNRPCTTGPALEETCTITTRPTKTGVRVYLTRRGGTPTEDRTSLDVPNVPHELDQLIARLTASLTAQGWTREPTGE